MNYPRFGFDFRNGMKQFVIREVVKKLRQSSYKLVAVPPAVEPNFMRRQCRSKMDEAIVPVAFELYIRVGG